MKRYNIIWLLLFVMYLVSSCSQNELESSDMKQDGDVFVKVFFKKASVARATNEVGNDDLNENKITTLDVFMYKEGGDECVFYQHIVPTPALTGVNAYSTKLNVYQEEFETNVNYETYVLANYSGSIPDKGLALSALKGLSVTGLNPDVKQDVFLMDGVHSMILNDGVVVNKEIPVSLKRAASKIRVKLSYANGYSVATGLAMSKKLIRYAASSQVLENGNSVVPDLQEMPDFTSTMVGADGDVAFVMYSYANDWNDDVNDETYILVNIPVTNGALTYTNSYYRIPVNYRLSAEGTDETLYKLQRNYLYDISVQVDRLGSPDPKTPVELSTQYTIKDWTTKDVLVSVEGINFLYVEDTRITMPNSTKFTTTFQSSTPVSISNIQVNGVASDGNGVNIEWTKDAKAGNIEINSVLPNNFVSKVVTFTVTNESGMTQNVRVEQFPALYIGYDISADAPGGSEGQNNNKMFVINSFVADFSTLPNPDEFDEDFGSGYSHMAANSALGASYASYIRNNAVLGYPRRDENGNTIDTEENNRMISPRFMLASQHGTTTASNYVLSRDKCSSYVERDETTGETYSDWRMPTLAELYMIDILQNIRLCEVKKILEGSWYWSARQSSAVEFMDPRVGVNSSFDSLKASVRCVRDVKVN